MLALSTNPSTFPIQNVGLRRTVIPNFLLDSDAQFSEQVQKHLRQTELSMDFGESLDRFHIFEASFSGSRCVYVR